MWFFSWGVIFFLNVRFIQSKKIILAKTVKQIIFKLYFTVRNVWPKMENKMVHVPVDLEFAAFVNMNSKSKSHSN